MLKCLHLHPQRDFARIFGCNVMGGCDCGWALRTCFACGRPTTCDHLSLSADKSYRRFNPPESHTLMLLLLSLWPYVCAMPQSITLNLTQCHGHATHRV